MTALVANGFSSFPETSWTLIHAAGAELQMGGREALDGLLRQYWPPLVAHLVFRKGVPLPQAEDLVQEFVLEKVLQGKLLQIVDPNKGNFRKLLLAALRNFLIDDVRQRGALGLAIQADCDNVTETDSDQFDLVWATQMLGESLQRMRAECQAKHRAEIWGIFVGRALAPLQGGEPLSYELLADQFALDSAKEAADLYTTAKRMVQRIFRKLLIESGGAESEALDFRKIIAGAGAELLESIRTYLWNTVPEVTMMPSQRASLDTSMLAHVLELASQPPDFAELLQQALAAPVPLDLAALGPSLAGSVHAWAKEQTLVLRSLADLLYHPNPLPELLDVAKRYAKDLRTDPHSPMPREVATVLYYGCIATALTRCGRRITSQSDEVLQQGFQWGFDQQWVDETLRRLLREGLERLRSA
jgi:DNA-directed RNA polymerase specialized sigma24 family protein